MSTYTEEEAKGKWCPAARITQDPNKQRPSWNRLVYSDDQKSMGPCCIGSACMWWRWAGLEPGKKPQDAERQGYCGMAGRPE